MGLRLFVKDGMFYPTEHGLVIGDVVDLVLVAGGNSKGTTTIGGDPGMDSFFGNYYVSLAGFGAPGGRSMWNSTRYGGRGGGGGFVPGAPFQGGAGLPAPLADKVWTYAPSTNGGGASFAVTVSSVVESGGVFSGAGTCFGGGDAGDYGSNCGLGGAGYGAGGGTEGQNSSSELRSSGNAGQIQYLTHVLTPEDLEYGIPITIGAGRNYGAFSKVIGAGLPATNDIKTKSTYAMVGPANLGTHGVSKTFELPDGTYGFTRASGTGSTAMMPTITEYVKFMGVDSVLSFNQCFPGFNSNFSYPIYVCGDYYVQLRDISTTALRVSWVLAEKAKTGTAATGDYGYVDYPQAAYGVSGFIDDSFVYCTGNSGRDFNVYQNWTPASTVPDITYTTSLGILAGTTVHFYVSADKKLYPVTMSSGSGGTTGRNVLSNYLTGAIESVVYNDNVMYMGQGNYVMSQSSSNSGQGYSSRHITSQSSGITDTPQNLPFFFGGATIVWLSSAQFRNVYASVFWPCQGDKVTWIENYTNNDAQATMILQGTAWGYNNCPGAPNGGGAGGCCMITW